MRENFNALGVILLSAFLFQFGRLVALYRRAGYENINKRTKSAKNLSTVNSTINNTLLIKRNQSVANASFISSLDKKRNESNNKGGRINVTEMISNMNNDNIDCSCPNYCTDTVLDRSIQGQGNTTCRSKIVSLMKAKNISEKKACFEASSEKFKDSASGYYSICSSDCNPTLCQANDTSSLTQPSQNETVYDVDFVVMLSGELGNHLLKIATGKVMELAAQEMKLPLNVTIHYLAQEFPKARKTAKQMKRCFPAFESVDLRECNVPSYEKIRNQQEKIFGSTFFIKQGLTTFDDIQNKLQIILDAVKNESMYIPFHQIQSMLNDNDILPLNIPFLILQRFCAYPLFERYYHELRDLFEFNEKACCKEKARVDETVVHIRGFLTEMPRVGKQQRYLELEPADVAEKLLNHLKPGDKVALLSRFPKILTPYKQELEKRLLDVRIVSDQNGHEDFCFLMSSTKELVGMLGSTYVTLAGILSSTVQKVTLYQTATSKTLKTVRKTNFFSNTTYINRTFQFPIYMI